jgi:integrase
MAKIKFILQSKTSNSQVYLRLSLSKLISYKRKTGYSIDYKDWSISSGFPKTNNPFNKNLKVDLKNLEIFIEKELNNGNTNGVDITSIWLKETIAKFLGKSTEKELDYLVDYTERYIERLKNRSNINGQKGVSEATIKKRTTILNKLIKFQEKSKRKLKVKDIDLDFREQFIDFLDKEENLAEGTIGRYLKEVKTICTDAQKNNIEVSSQLIHFKGFTSESIKITLSFDEIEQIKKIKFKDKSLETTRNWLVIGCYTGQRVSDLLRMNKTMIEEHYGFEFIVLTQKKTKKIVQIPIHKEVKSILVSLDGSFPPVFSKNESSNSTLFNRYLKLVCKDAELTYLAEGKFKNKESNRLEVGKYPKYKLVSSHICRRSFATNFYAEEKYPTPLLMNITAHGTEKMFLNYIGKKPIDYGVQLAKIWEKEKL